MVLRRILFFSAFTFLPHSPLMAAEESPKLRIGVALSQSSPVAMLGQEQVQGVQLAEQHFKKLLPQLEIIFEDSAGDETSAVHAFQALMRKDVLGIIGPTLSQQAFAASPLANRAGIPVLGPSNTAKGIPEIGDFVARVSAPIATVAPFALKAAQKQQAQLKNVALLYAQNDAFSSSEYQTFRDTVQADKSLKLVSTQKFQTTDSDFTTQVAAVLKESPDLVIISGLAADGGNLVKQLRQTGYKGLIIGGNGLNTPQVFPVCQSYCDGLFIAQAYSPESPLPINQTLTALSLARFKKKPGQFAAQAFTAVQVFVEAWQRSAAKKEFAALPLKEKRRVLNQEILSGQYQTPLGTLRFSPQGEVLQESFYVAKIKMDADGKSGSFHYQSF